MYRQPAFRKPTSIVVEFLKKRKKKKKRGVGEALSCRIENVLAVGMSF